MAILGVVLGASSAFFGGAYLGWFAGRLGAVLGRLGSILGCFGAVLGCLGEPGDVLGATWEPGGYLWGVLTTSWRHLEAILGRLGASEILHVTFPSTSC